MTPHSLATLTMRVAVAYLESRSMVVSSVSPRRLTGKSKNCVLSAPNADALASCSIVKVAIHDFKSVAFGLLALERAFER